MLRMLTRVYDDQTSGNVWVNPDHVSEVRPTTTSARTHCLVFIDGKGFTVLGSARDTALALNGHFDEG